MRVKIKDVENGWLVHYDVMEYDPDPDNYRKVGEREKAFTYDFEDEKEDVWRRLGWFLANEFLGWELRDKIYVRRYDEEKGEWVGNEEFERRRKENGEVERLKKGDSCFCGLDFTYMTWDKEKVCTITREQWEIECANWISKKLLWHFGRNESMSYDEYVEIKNAAVKQFTKKFGLKPQIQVKKE